MANSKKVYINGIGVVSPQGAFTETAFLSAPLPWDGNAFRCPDPGYRQYIPADMIRRMARVIRMGVTASGMCLNDVSRQVPGGDAGLPDAIITGTGWGCLEDTEKFLSALTLNHEQMLTPTSFIQSTHNTVAGQIAQLLKCHGYNFTYVQRGISFESALLDAILQLRQGECRHILAGASDEVTAGSLAVLTRLDVLKKNPVTHGQLFTDAQRGTIAGEGAAFFSLDTQQTSSAYAELAAVTGFRRPAGEKELTLRTEEFLNGAGVAKSEIDVILTGRNGDPESDSWYELFLKGFPSAAVNGNFKHLCGDYPTASSFGMAVAAYILKTRQIPDHLGIPRKQLPQGTRNALIYNHYVTTHHALILLRTVNPSQIEMEKHETELLP